MRIIPKQAHDAFDDLKTLWLVLHFLLFPTETAARARISPATLKERLFTFYEASQKMNVVPEQLRCALFFFFSFFFFFKKKKKIDFTSPLPLCHSLYIFSLLDGSPISPPPQISIQTPKSRSQSPQRDHLLMEKQSNQRKRRQGQQSHATQNDLLMRWQMTQASPRHLARQDKRRLMNIHQRRPG